MWTPTQSVRALPPFRLGAPPGAFERRPAANTAWRSSAVPHRRQRASSGPSTALTPVRAPVCAAPPQQYTGTVHVAASNDGAVFSSPPRVTGKGAGSYLLYRVVDGRPWGQWLLSRAAFPAQGGSTLEVQLRGLLNDGEPDGGVFLDTGLAHCAFSTSLRRTFAAFGPIAFAPNASAVPGRNESALAALVMAPSPGSGWDAAVQTDATYEVQALPGGTTFQWRRYPAGAPPLPTADPGWVATGSNNSILTFPGPTELELGVFIGVPAAAWAASASAKRAGDSWTWTALTTNPTVTTASVASGRDAACPVPGYAAGGGDGDPTAPGLQQEVKVSLRGAHPFSAVQLFSGGNATGLPRAPTPLSRDTALRCGGFYTGDVAQTYEVLTSVPGPDTAVY